jgi:succinoglycan biosynthesis transport protein ExoP
MSRASEPRDQRCHEPTGAIVPGGRSSASSIDLFGESSAALGAALPAAEKSAPGLSIAQLWMYKWTILVVFVLVAGPAIVAIWALVVPEYRAGAEVRVSPIIPRLVFKTEDNGQIPLYQSYLNTQVSVIRSPTVLQRVLDQQEVQGTSWYREPDGFFGATSVPLERLRKALTVKPRGRTEIIDINMLARKPNEAATIVNAVLDQYVMYVREISEQTDDTLYRQLQERHSVLKSRIEGQEALVANLRRELGTGSPEELVAQKRVRLDEAQAKLNDLRREVSTAEWRSKQLTAMIEERRVAATRPSTQPVKRQLRYEDDGEWRRLSAALKQAQLHLDVNRDRYGDSHPKMLELAKAVKVAEGMLREREAQLQAHFADVDPFSGGVAKGGSRRVPKTLEAQLDELSREVALLKYREGLLAKQYEQEKAEFSRAFETAQTLNRETEAIKQSRELYEAVRDRLNQKETERNVPGSISVLSRGYPPSEPDQDRRLLLTALALFVAASFGVGAAFLRANLSESINAVADVPVVTAPFLGQLPLLRDPESCGAQELATQSEYIRMVRTALLQRLDGRRGNVILVTSAESESGKTTVAMLLGKSLAHCGKRVLLVDADLRNPCVAKRLGLQSGPGLVAALRAGAPDAKTIVPCDTDRLSVLPAGDRWEGNEPELLANGTFSNCLDRWRSQYDIVLLDSSPVLPVADARILSRHADGTIMVVREGHCRRADVVDALAHLVTAGAKLVGTVFIGSIRRGTYGSGYYTYAYGGSSVTPS